MRSIFDVRKAALILGAAAILTSGGLAACAKEKPAETPPTSAPVVSETEKASFEPPVKAKPAPGAQTHNDKIGQPGNH